ncbi:aromatic acid/H+ symport family MFS transporter [Streptomyces ficellus]|uniref:Aromatic acid/H+ symport family MFS transporter n=1 Tax=Streptomyces ficellus TaxID=1977088 RepID=A0ABT7Z8I8_9ACTN|nr:aromatic acid/H+ symport family MFS transporter [Streptomyces ficellus]MDN3295809.1 aromatic acid/H+ symport family MFS transporter [Streptomyces ficellus]
MNARQDIRREARHRKTLRWIVGIAAVTLLFDGYDLVVYGTVVPTLLRDPSQLGALTPGEAGALGSYALIGVMVGALAAGAIGDHVGRRRIMLVNIAWFSLGMGLTAVTTSVTAFGFLRFFTGVGVGALVATVGAMVAEFAPPDRRNFYNAIVYSGVPAGGVLAALLAMFTSDAIGWRGLFLVGALPIVLLLPVAVLRLPESPAWLLARGHEERARRVCERTGVPLPAAERPAGAAAYPPKVKVGFPALATRRYAVATFFLGLTSFCALLLTYGLNTWLPEIMGRNGYGTSYALAFLLALNGGAIVGGLLASRVADRLGPQRVVAATFALAAVSLALLTMELPLGVLLGLVAVAGVGTLGTQVLIYGFVSTYYDTVARAAGVAWCAGFGRLGGIGGPVVGGALVGAGVPPLYAFYVFAAVALLGLLVTGFVPRRPAPPAVDRAVGPALATPGPRAEGGASVLGNG